MMPTAGSTGSSTRSRPAPSPTEARPTSSASRCVEKSGARRADEVARGGRRHPLIVVDDPRIAALLLDDPAEPLEAGPGGDRVARPIFTVAQVVGDPAEHEHARRQCNRQVNQIGGAAALQDVDALDHFERVADRAAERRVHPRDDRFGLHARRVADRHERLGQAARIGFASS